MHTKDQSNIFQDIAELLFVSLWIHVCVCCITQIMEEPLNFALLLYIVHMHDLLFMHMRQS